MSAQGRRRIWRAARWAALVAVALYLMTSIHWLLVGSYLITLARILLLMFAPALVAGLGWGLWRGEAGFARRRVPGWVWYGLIELAATATKAYPFFWGNVVDMVLPTPRLWLSLPVGLVAGVYCLREAGKASEWGYRLAGRMAGFGKAFPPTGRRGRGHSDTKTAASDLSSGAA